MPYPPGTVIDRYTVLQAIGQGGMAVVYKVRHNQLGTIHALKLLSLPANPLRDRFRQEAQIQAKLRHPNIVAVTDFIEYEQMPGLVMEHVDGPTLEDLLGRHRPTLEQVDSLVEGILAGVAHAHRQGLIHRDLKPANVLLESTDAGLIPKVADFGLAKLTHGDGPSGVGHTHSGVVMGTPSYMAPEQIRDSKSVDQRADVFSLGVILYELVAGERPFNGPDIIAIFSAIAYGRYKPVRDVVPELPDRMLRAIEGSLQVDRRVRIPDAQTLLSVWMEQGTAAMTPAPIASRVNAPPPRQVGWTPELAETVKTLHEEMVAVRLMTKAEEAQALAEPTPAPAPAAATRAAAVHASLPTGPPASRRASDFTISKSDHGRVALDIAPATERASGAAPLSSIAIDVGADTGSLDASDDFRSPSSRLLPVAALGGAALIALALVGGGAWAWSNGMLGGSADASPASPVAEAVAGAPEAAPAPTEAAPPAVAAAASPAAEPGTAEARPTPPPATPPKAPVAATPPTPAPKAPDEADTRRAALEAIGDEPAPEGGEVGGADVGGTREIQVVYTPPAPAEAAAAEPVEPAAVEVVVDTARIAISGVQGAYLKGAYGTYSPGEALSPGRYEVMVNFDGGGVEPALSIEVAAGDNVRVTCSPDTRSCTR